LEPLNIEGLSLGVRLGAARKIPANAFSIQPAGNSKNDVPGGIREL
jgi:hypothetical protein